MDRISNLPGNAIDCILERLPLVDRVRTSVLASSWRSRWTELPSLEVDRRLFARIGETETLERPSIPFVYIMIVNSILFQVKANVRKFSLYVPEECDQLAHTALSHLIQFVLSNGVRKLSVSGHYDLPFRLPPLPFLLPSSVFSSPHLTHLYLSHCRLNLQASSGGLPNLIVLYVASVEAEGEEISRLISSCPQLEKLSLWGSYLVTLHLPSSVFSCTHLIELYLSHCQLNLQASCWLPNLIVLELISVVARGEEISHLISSCPQLEKLSALYLFEDNFCNEKLHISAPRLNTLRVKGSFKSLSVQNGQNLIVLDVDSYHDLRGGSTNLSGAIATFFEGMEKLEQVSLSSYFCELLALSGAPQTNLSLGRLKRLKLCALDSGDPDLFRFVVSLICSSSNLKELDLSFEEYGVRVPQVYKASFENNDYNFGHLVRVNLVGFRGTMSQMKIVRLLLKGSPILEEMSLQIPVKMKRIKRELKGYDLASSRVKISYYN